MLTKKELFSQVAALLDKQGFRIIQEDRNRPWGGFYVLDETQARDFARTYFPGEDFEGMKSTVKLSPKVLMVAPEKRLSWQYHHRRAEIWRCVEGEVAIVTSHTDKEDKKHFLQPGDIIRLQQGERHRLIGLSSWGVVAEIWQHTDPDHPSDEEDIVRLQDDFGR